MGRMYQSERSEGIVTPSPKMFSIFLLVCLLIPLFSHISRLAEWTIQTLWSWRKSSGKMIFYTLFSSTWYAFATFVWSVCYTFFILHYPKHCFRSYSFRSAIFTSLWRIALSSLQNLISELGAFKSFKVFVTCISVDTSTAILSQVIDSLELPINTT